MMNTNPTDSFSPASCWQNQLLEMISIIDMEQSPHGLYGLRDVMKDRDYPLPWSKLFNGKIPQTNLATRLGWPQNDYRSTTNVLDYEMPSGVSLRITVEDFASTKVRSYGSAYVLDAVHGKKEEPDVHFLKSRVPKVAKDVSAWRYEDEPHNEALLFIAHVSKTKHFDQLLGKTTAPFFLKRYNLSHNSLSWNDRYDRGFDTGLFLWSTRFPSQASE